MTRNTGKPKASAGKPAQNTPPNRPLCFVLMPFGKKPDAGGKLLDFDAIYRDLIHPAVEAADLTPIRADEEQVGGIIHKPMFERLILCEYAVADLTLANANVFYELGIRHALRPRSTVLLFSAGSRLPFDLALARGLPYGVGRSGAPADARGDGRKLTELLKKARESHTDSPLFQLVDDLQPPDVSRLKTDVFRSAVQYSARLKERLAEGRQAGVDAIDAIQAELGSLADVETGVVIDLLLSYRAVKAWKPMIALVERMPEPLRRTVMVREQYALALNRDGQGEKAERVLLDLVKERGPSSETYGILGRVYKDRWEEANTAGESAHAKGLLDKAIDAYLKGFETDWRDAYPGINALTLMELRDPPDPRRKELAPVVTYAVERRIDAGQPDYWDKATLLELAVLREDREAAEAALADALAAVREVWEPETTLRNLRLIREAREKRGATTEWTVDVEANLQKAVDRRSG